MAVFYVFQGQTYTEERRGGYVWSPQLDNRGGKNAGYTMMTKIRKGDFILHNCNGKIVSIGIAEDDYYEASQPKELQLADTTVQWNNDGYRVDVDYFDFDVPVTTTDYKEWLAQHYVEGSAFNRSGTGKQQYMCHLADTHAIFLIKKAIALQKEERVLKYLKAALAEIIEDEDSEYNQVEIESINELVEDTNDVIVPTWSGKKEAQTVITSSNTMREIPKRDPRRAADALAKANFQCEFDKNDRTFLRKNGKPYTEPHHLIPISKYRDFSYSVDVMENIVSLCSHCHNLLHYGQSDDKKRILEKLYNERKDALHNCGLDLSLEQLESYYK